LIELVLALVFFAFALGSKESAILCFPIFFLIFNREREKDFSFKDAVMKTAPFAVLAAVYFIVWRLILGAFAIPPEESVGTISAILSVPKFSSFISGRLFFPSNSARIILCEPLRR
jgi:hypothetical protein